MQLCDDIQWLYGALQASTGTRGKPIIKQFAASKDGILAWSRFLEVFRFNGDVDVFLAEQQEVLKTQFSHTYPGGAIKFLESYETAFINIDAVMHHK